MEHVSEVLRALVGDLDCDVIGVSGECPGQAVLLARGEAFTPGAEDVPDPEQRVALAAAVAEGLLLNSAADVIDRCAGELDDVEGVQHAGGVLELVIDRVLVSLERVQRRDLDLLPEPLTALAQPVAIDRPGPTWDEVEQPRSGVGSSGQVHHPGERFRPAPARVTVVPDVLVHAQDLHALEPRRVFRGPGQDGLDLGPERVPGRAELAGEALDRRSLTAELTDRPADRARAQQAPRGANLRVLLRNVATLQTSSRQTQRRLRQRIRTGRPAQGASITSTAIRP